MAWHQLDTQAITWTNADLNVMKNHNKNKLLKFLFSSRKQTIILLEYSHLPLISFLHAGCSLL